MLTAVLLATLVASAAVGLQNPHLHDYRAWQYAWQYPWYHSWYYPSAGLQRSLLALQGPHGVPLFYRYLAPSPYLPAGLQKGSYVTSEGPGGSSVLHEGVAYQVGDQFKQR